MTSPTRLASGLMILTVLAACEPAEDDAPAPPAIEEIPVTTSSPEALAAFERGRRLMDVDRSKEANAEFEAAVAADPDFAYAHVNIARTAQSWKEFNDAQQQAQAHLEGKSEGERLLAEILKAFFDRDAEARVELGQTLVETYPRSPRAWLVLAGIQGELNQQVAARESIKQARALDPDFIAAHVAAWGSYLFREPRDLARAEQAMLDSLELRPDEAKLYVNLGDVYRAMQQLEKAAEMYARAAALEPGYTVAHIKKGHVQSFLGNFEQALDDFDAGLANATEQDRITFANFRAFTHLHAGDPRASLDELASLVAAADASDIPEDQVAGAKIFTLRHQLIIALHHGYLEEAEGILAQLTAAVRDNVEHVGAPELARQQEADLLRWQSHLAARQGDAETALARAEEHRQLLENDNNPRRFEAYHGLLGLIELLRGNHTEAVEHFRKSDLGEIYVKYHLALAVAGAGDTEEAKRLFKEVAEWNFNSVGFALVRQDALARSS